MADGTILHQPTPDEPREASTGDNHQATNAAREIGPVDTALLRAAFTQAQAQIMNNGQFEPVVVISKSLALQLLDEIDSLRVVR